MHRLWNNEIIQPLDNDEQPGHYLLQAIFTDLLLDKKTYNKFIKFFPDTKLSYNLINYWTLNEI